MEERACLHTLVSVIVCGKSFLLHTCTLAMIPVQCNDDSHTNRASNLIVDLQWKLDM